jgi:hypothetical protein
MENSDKFGEPGRNRDFRDDLENVTHSHYLDEVSKSEFRLSKLLVLVIKILMDRASIWIKRRRERVRIDSIAFIVVTFD